MQDFLKRNISQTSWGMKSNLYQVFGTLCIKGLNLQYVETELSYDYDFLYTSWHP